MASPQLRPFHQQIRSPGADFGWSSVDVRTSERPLERSSWPLAGDPGSDSALALAIGDLLHDGTWLCLKMGYCAIASIDGNSGKILQNIDWPSGFSMAPKYFFQGQNVTCGNVW